MNSKFKIQETLHEANETFYFVELFTIKQHLPLSVLILRYPIKFSNDTNWIHFVILLILDLSLFHEQKYTLGFHLKYKLLFNLCYSLEIPCECVAVTFTGGRFDDDLYCAF